MANENEEPESTEETTADGSGDREIDLNLLAEKVYKLLVEEVRLERERRGLRSTG
jgi:hypothetical protein